MLYSHVFEMSIFGFQQPGDDAVYRLAVPRSCQPSVIG